MPPDGVTARVIPPQLTAADTRAVDDILKRNAAEIRAHNITSMGSVNVTEFAQIANTVPALNNLSPDQIWELANRANTKKQGGTPPHPEANATVADLVAEFESSRREVLTHALNVRTGTNDEHPHLTPAQATNLRNLADMNGTEHSLTTSRLEDAIRRANPAPTNGQQVVDAARHAQAIHLLTVNPAELGDQDKRFLRDITGTENYHPPLNPEQLIAETRRVMANPSQQSTLANENIAQGIINHNARAANTVTHEELATISRIVPELRGMSDREIQTIMTMANAPVRAAHPGDANAHASLDDVKRVARDSRTAAQTIAHNIGTNPNPAASISQEQADNLTKLAGIDDVGATKLTKEDISRVLREARVQNGNQDLPGEAAIAAIRRAQAEAIEVSRAAGTRTLTPAETAFQRDYANRPDLNGDNLNQAVRDTIAQLPHHPPAPAPAAPGAAHGAAPGAAHGAAPAADPALQRAWDADTAIRSTLMSKLTDREMQAMSQGRLRVTPADLIQRLNPEEAHTMREQLHVIQAYQRAHPPTMEQVQANPYALMQAEMIRRANNQLDHMLHEREQGHNVGRCPAGHAHAPAHTGANVPAASPDQKAAVQRLHAHTHGGDSDTHAADDIAKLKTYIEARQRAGVIIPANVTESMDQLVNAATNGQNANGYQNDNAIRNINNVLEWAQGPANGTTVTPPLPTGGTPTAPGPGVRR